MSPFGNIRSDVPKLSPGLVMSGGLVPLRWLLKCSTNNLSAAVEGDISFQLVTELL